MLKDLCTDPDYDEELECVCEPGNLNDPGYAVAVKRRFLEMQLLLDVF